VVILTFCGIFYCMQIVADLHLHSKYSRAVSKHMDLEIMVQMAEIKGIDLLSCGDFTHPAWIDEIREKLKETERGVYKLNNNSKVRYLLGTEISCIFTQGGKGRRIHTLVFAPSIEIVEKINKKLRERGCNFRSDGRPIIGLSLIELCRILFSIDENIVVIPAHVWTPWFGMLGSKSGFDSLRECYGDYAEKIYAIETGLSSDPSMNWQIEEFDNLSIVSFSDAHSPAKLGRELTIFESSGKNEFCYVDFMKALQKKGKWRISKTLEFYPEEGKYHIDGHRNCGVWQEPSKTKKIGRTCSVCGKILTLGVMGRVEELSRKKKIETEKKDINENCVYGSERKIPYIKIVPLLEILSEALEKGVNTKTVKNKYDEMIKVFGTEIDILIKIPIKKIKEWDSWIGGGIERVRRGQIYVRPGYDGVFGQVKIWRDEMAEKEDESKKQMTLF
jgi:uncharacterized protein (TIGR00375 family)